MLMTFWIKPKGAYGQLGYGVTAFGVEDALQLIRDQGFDVPDDTAEVAVRPGVTFAELDQEHVVPNMGPIVMRGVWFPCRNLGYPPNPFRLTQ